MHLQKSVLNFGGQSAKMSTWMEGLSSIRRKHDLSSLWEETWEEFVDVVCKYIMDVDISTKEGKNI